MYEFQLNNIQRCHSLDDGEEVTILRNLNASFEMGRLSALVGPSGGGKSTLLRLLNRLDEPDGGEVMWRGKPLPSYAVRQLRRKVAFMPQQTTVFTGSLEDNLLLPRSFCQPPPPTSIQGELIDLLKQVGLSQHLLTRPAAELSGGEKQRLALARALLTRPEVLVLDEPGYGLDPPARAQLCALLRQLVDSGLTVILSSHDIPFVRRVADNFLFLTQGKISVTGQVDELDLASDQELRSFIAAEGE